MRESDPSSGNATYDASDIYYDGQYLQNNAGWHAEDSPWKARQIDKILAHNNIAPQLIAEVGCGAGEILKELSINYPKANFVGYEAIAAGLPDL